jgi:hypothetical protein
MRREMGRRLSTAQQDGGPGHARPGVDAALFPLGALQLSTVLHKSARLLARCCPRPAACPLECPHMTAAALDGRVSAVDSASSRA